MSDYTKITLADVISASNDFQEDFGSAALQLFLTKHAGVKTARDVPVKKRFAVVTALLCATAEHNQEAKRENIGRRLAAIASKAFAARSRSRT